MAKPPDAKPKKPDWVTWANDFVSRPYWVGIYKMANVPAAADEMSAPSYERALCPVGWLATCEILMPDGAQPVLVIKNTRTIVWAMPKEPWGIPAFLGFFRDKTGGPPLRIVPIHGTVCLDPSIPVPPQMLTGMLKIEEQ